MTTTPRNPEPGEQPDPGGQQAGAPLPDQAPTVPQPAAAPPQVQQAAAPPPPAAPPPGQAGAPDPAAAAAPPPAGQQAAAPPPPPPAAGAAPAWAVPAPRPRGAFWRTTAGVVVAGVAALVIGLVGGFALGRGTAPSGPDTLADAVRQAQRGELPPGDLRGGRGLGRGRLPFGPDDPGGPGNRRGLLPGRGGAGIQGQVTAVDGDTLTIQTLAGQIRVRLNASTRIQKTTAGGRGDLTTGRQVSVQPDLGASSAAGEVVAGTITAE